MTVASNHGRRLRVLLSEGSSTSAREAITALGLMGHQVELCDPNPTCLGRFSRFLHRFHRCPGLGTDPTGFLDFLLELLSRERFDILLPIHEQGFVLAKAQEQIASRVAIALPSFQSYRKAHSKTGFHQLLSGLGLPHPRTEYAASASELRERISLPCVVKTSVGTASRGTWILHSEEDVARAIAELEAVHAFDDPILVQDLVAGKVEHAQAVFCRGELVAMHAYVQVAAGAGGGDAIKESVRRPLVRMHLARIGERLAWHGALSVDYIAAEHDESPHYIDCNPRLVEPMSAVLSGVDLVDLLLRVSLGEKPATVVAGREATRTHLAMQALLGAALRTGSRLELVRQLWRLAAGRGEYAGSVEELTPVGLDWVSAVPATMTALLLLVNPGFARELPKRGWGSHLLTPKSIRLIEERLECSS
jgi:predicted ATP-grasp superfamily ATP-dependent carboligase